MTKGTHDPHFGNLINKYTLMYCGISPSEIDAMNSEEVELFAIYFTEMKKIEIGGANGR